MLIKNNKHKPNPNSTNGIWWTSPHRASNALRLGKVLSTNRTRSSHNTIPYSRITSWAHCLPILSVLVLLALMSVLVMPDLFSPLTNSANPFSNTNNVYATESSSTFATDSTSQYAAQSTPQPESITNTTASLILNTNDIHKDAAPGTIAYASKNIVVKAVNITDYTLSITAPTSLSGNTDFTSIDSEGANPEGLTPSNMPDNSWGYSYVPEGLTSSNNVNGSDEVDDLTTIENLSYLSFTGKPQTLEHGNIPSNNTRTIVFAAKFGSNAINGNYTADITISLATTPAKVVFDNITTMQAMTPDICNKASLYDSAFLRDTRDNNYYTVTKLNDGRCWMTSNLALSAPAGGRVLTPSDSNVTSNWTMPATLTELSDTNFRDENYYTVESYITTPNITSGKTGYYSWSAATAGTGGANGSNYVNVNANAPSSICPKGWRLPMGGMYTSGTNQNEFYNLFVTVLNPNLASVTPWWYYKELDAAVNVKDIPYNFTSIGHVTSYGLANVNSDGAWWTSTSFSDTYAYQAAMIGQYHTVYPGTNGYYRSFGYAVRCIAEEEKTIETITTMQEMTPEICEKAKIGDTATLTDNRTYPSGIGNIYTIRKHEDGKCWMLQDLRITGVASEENPNGTTLTPSDSDVYSNYTLPISSKAGWSTSSYSVQSVLNTGIGYYSWCAATAGSCTYSGNAASSICPKGWRIPTGGVNMESDFYKLIINMKNINIASLNDNGSTYISSMQRSIIQGNDYGFAYNRYVDNGSVNYNTSYGWWWSSTGKDSTMAYAFQFNDSYIYPGNYNGARLFGYAIRCVAK